MTLQTVTTFYAFDPNLRCGVNVAIGDVNGDGVDDIIVGSGAQPGVGAAVKVIDGTKLGMVDANGEILDSATIAEFSPFGTFDGGVNVAAGNLFGSPDADVVVAPGDGGGGFYQAYRGVDLADGNTNPFITTTPISDPNYRGGLSVAIADYLKLGSNQILATPGPGGGPVVLVLDPLTGGQLATFSVGDPGSRTGADVAS